MTVNKNHRVAVVDYGMCNLYNVERACSYVGLQPFRTANKIQILSADAVILPGVGAFGQAIKNLEKLDLIFALKEIVAKGTPLFGICLGMQLLMSESEEFGCHGGLDLIKGHVIKFRNEKQDPFIKIPQIGWNQIRYESAKQNQIIKSPLSKTRNGEFMYFVHSYYVKPCNEDIVLTKTRYGDDNYCSSLVWKNVFATQFHPEKSGIFGLQIYQEWASLITEKGNEL